MKKSEASPIESEPEQHLLEAVRDLRRVVAHAGALSMTLTGEPTDKFGELGSITHARMWANAHSMLAIVDSRVSDHSALLTLSRMIMEGFIMLSYTYKDVSSDEKEFRYLLFKYHDTNSRINLMRIGEERSSYQDLIDGRAAERTGLETHPYFQKLLPDQQGRCLSGTQVYVRGLRQAAIEAGFDERKFNSLYGYFSGHSHTLPISLFRAAVQEIDYFRPSHAQYGMGALAISIALPCLLGASFKRIELEDMDPSWKDDPDMREMLRDWAMHLIPGLCRDPNPDSPIPG